MNFDPIQSLTITVVTGANRILGRVTGVTASRQNRERWSLILKREGCTEYTVNGRKLLSDNLHPILLPKGSSYLWRCIQPGEYITIDFNADETLKEPLSFAVVDNKPLIHAFTQIEQSLYRQDSLTQLECKSHLYNILVFLARSQKDYIPKEKVALIHPAIRYLEEHYHDTAICNEQLAKLCGTSTVYFRKVFSSIYGVSPIKYLNDLRISKAKSILASDYDSIAQVAESVGFSNIYHFSKMFKKHTGISPSLFASTPKQKEPTESP